MVQQKLVSSEKTKNENNFYQDEPQLRFREFSEPFKEVLLGDISSNGMYGMNCAGKEFDGENKYIRITDIDENSHNFVPNPLSSPDGGLEDKFLLKENDIVFARTGASTGKSYLYDKNDGKLYFAGFLIKLEITNAYAPFVYYNTLRENYNNWVSIMSVRSGQPGINLEEYKKFKINLPSLEEQKKIASFLSVVDKKIELLEKKYQKVSLLKDYYYSEIFNILTLDTLKIEYRELSLEEIVTKFSTGLNPRKNFKLNDGGSNFYVTIKNFENGLLNLDEKCDKIDDNALNLINKRSDLKKDDLIFASIGRVGEVYLIKEDPVNWNINESVFSLRGDKNKVNPKFLYCLMKSKRVQHYFDIHITGSTFKSIKMKDLRKTPITLPCDISEQEYIADFLLKFEKKCYLMERQIKGFNQFKKGLLQKMFI